MHCNILIENDLFNIVDRIKEIDDGYFIIYNTSQCRFEVHNKFQPYNSLCLIVPFNRLDARTVHLVRSTRPEFADRVIGNIERDNLIREREQSKQIVEKHLSNFEKLLSKGDL